MEVRRIPLLGTGVKIGLATVHFHDFGVARAGPWNTWVNKGKKRRAGVLGPGPSYLVDLRSPKTLVVPVQLPPYGSIGVRIVVDVDVVSSGMLP
jgi:hypothetical protein